MFTRVKYPEIDSRRSALDAAGIRDVGDKFCRSVDRIVLRLIVRRWVRVRDRMTLRNAERNTLRGALSPSVMYVLRRDDGRSANVRACDIITLRAQFIHAVSYASEFARRARGLAPSFHEIWRATRRNATRASLLFLLFPVTAGCSRRRSETHKATESKTLGCREETSLPCLPVAPKLADVRRRRPARLSLLARSWHFRSEARRRRVIVESKSRGKRKNEKPRAHGGESKRIRIVD